MSNFFSRHVMQKDLESLGIPCTLVLDSSIGYIMSEIDYVLVGAEGVVESGGIINKVGFSGLLLGVLAVIFAVPQKKSERKKS